MPPVNIRYAVKIKIHVTCIEKNCDNILYNAHRTIPKKVPTIGKKTTDPAILFSLNFICGKGILVRKRKAVYKFIFTSPKNVYII